MSDLADYADMEPPAQQAGAVLRKAREARGLAVDDIALALKLTPKQVVAIESDEFDLLPGNTFARGFVRNYARLLQLDPAPLLAAVESRLSGGEVDLRPLSNAVGRMPAGTPSRGVPRVLLAGLVLAVIALAVGVYMERFGSVISGWQSKPAVESQSEPPAPGSQHIELPTPVVPAAGPAAIAVETPTAMPPQVAAAPAVAEAAPPAPTAAADTAAKDAAPAATEGTRRLAFRFDKEAWVEVKDGSGKLLASRLNPAGSVLRVEGQPPFALVVGNAASVELRLDDRLIDLKPHTSVSVARLRLE